MQGGLDPIHKGLSNRQIHFYTHILKKCDDLYKITSALIVQSHDDRGVCALIVMGIFGCK